MFILDLMRIIAGSFFVAFLPGYAITRVVFDEREISFIEKITLSIVFSITAIPLIIIILYKIFGVRVNILNTTIVILLVVLFSYAYKRGHGE